MWRWQARLARAFSCHLTLVTGRAARIPESCNPANARAEPGRAGTQGGPGQAGPGLPPGALL